MRKSILMGLGLAVAMAGTAVAQQPSDSARGAKAPGAGRERFQKRGGAPEGFLLRGITLTEAQKTQLKTLRQTERSTLKAQRENGRKGVEEIRAARQRGDTATARALALRQRQEMAQARERHVAAVRNLLTAEQRVQFDKNVAEIKQRQAERGNRFGPRGRGPGRAKFGR
jgi:Spy/CpxP family protein refolding chaperone